MREIVATWQDKNDKWHGRKFEDMDEVQRWWARVRRKTYQSPICGYRDELNLPDNIHWRN